MTIVRALLAFFALGMLSLAGSPAVAKIDLVPGIEKEGGNELIAVDSHIRYGFTVSNTSDGDVTVRIVPRAVLRARPIACTSCASLTWSVNGHALRSYAKGVVPLPRGQEIQLIVEGDLPDFDVYEASALIEQVSGAGREAATIAKLRIVRKRAGLGATPIVAIEGGRYLTGVPASIVYHLTNGGDNIVGLKSPPVAQFRKDEGGDKFADPVQIAAVNSTCEPAFAAGKAYEMLPGDRAKCTAALPALDPGRYRADITLDQKDLEHAAATADFSVRYDWCIAAWCLFGGSLIGALFAFYRGVLQRRLDQERRALELREAYTSFRETLDLARQPQACRIAAEQQSALTAVVEGLRRDSSQDFANGLTKAAALLPSLRVLALLEPDYKGNQTDETTQALQTVLQAMAADPLSQSELSVALEKLREALASPPSTVRGFRPARGITASIINAVPDHARIAMLRITSIALELFFSLVSMGLSVAIGVGALWVPNESWGGFFDIVVAVLTGVTGTAAGTLSLKTIAEGYTARIQPPS